MESKTVNISEIKNNPDNPRIIKDDKFTKLVESIKAFPEMLNAREIVVNTDMVILGGNMRFRAAKEAGLKEIPIKIVDWSEEKQREFVIKDNVSGGEWDWDKIANEWNMDELDDWGLDVPKGMGDDDEELTAEDENESVQVIVVVAYKNIEDLDRITEFYDLEATDIPSNVKDELGRQRKMYVYKK